MKKSLLVICVAIISLSASGQDCFTRIQKAFDERGAYSVADDMHRNVILSFFEDGSSYCISGKARVENGFIISVFKQFQDDTYELMEKKFYNSEKKSPTIVNGISEMIYDTDREKFKVVFIETLKPKQKEYKEVTLPDGI
ncbi:MAG: hypothetical protein P8M19_06525 [Crocinitomicaceae bacterium]|jgi:hypothetical protein|nr:hypothetical protein [Crocinitomicaceae bacterium]MDG1659404.1 hypothetical protein [Crocinitomicaceae bacterium]MDG2441304.1 hypothetical protein [Crocinitomicaceae bacterium]|tara:strand:+ start:171 stop:590 length:420 start_codon:yes stop_codon:yes gene_type:complete